MDKLKQTRQNKFYRKHRTRLIEERVTRKRGLKLWLRRLKRKLGCVRCGFRHPAALQFHHKKPEEKEFDICSGVLNGRSKEVLEREIAKCEILCANCHAIEHYGK